MEADGLKTAKKNQSNKQLPGMHTIRDNFEEQFYV